MQVSSRVSQLARSQQLRASNSLCKDVVSSGLRRLPACLPIPGLNPGWRQPVQLTSPQRVVATRFQTTPSVATSPICEDCDDDCLEVVEDGETVIVRDDLEALLVALPENIRDTLANHPDRAHLLEVVLDLGRRPEARFLGTPGGEYLSECEITAEDLRAAEQAVGSFGQDNRAGITGTLHRISAIRNRRREVVGLTCRVGRAVTGHTDMIRDLVLSQQSVLMLGRPGVGKTTVIREIARVLSVDMKKRVVIVDSSNEIGGDGDVPHPTIGMARRMQVAEADKQHMVMIEAVENHMPEVIIVDEIGTEAEALACRSIAERGVMLIGTAHGRLLENLMKNPTLCDLVGGVESVTLGDDEARSRGSQKTVLERKGPPTFPIVVEIRERSFYVAHWAQDSVDAILQGKTPVVQVRERCAASGEVKVTEVPYDKVMDPQPAPIGVSSYEEAYEEALSSSGDPRGAGSPMLRQAATRTPGKGPTARSTAAWKDVASRLASSLPAGSSGSSGSSVPGLSSSSGGVAEFVAARERSSFLMGVSATSATRAVPGGKAAKKTAKKGGR